MSGPSGLRDRINDAAAGAREAAEVVRSVASNAVGRAVQLGVDYGYVREKKKKILGMLAQVGVGSSVKVLSGGPERRALDEMAVLQVISESGGAFEMLDFGAHVTITRVGDIHAGSHGDVNADRAYFRRNGSLVGVDGVAARSRVVDAALRLARWK